MSEMVERVAKAIYGAVYDGADTSWEGLVERAKTDGYPHAKRFHALTLASARAAIEAMREPTEAMLEASWRTTVKAPVDSRIACLLATPRDAHVHKMLLRYRAVIDAALSD